MEYVNYALQQRNNWWEDKLKRLISSLESDDINVIKEDIEYVLRVTSMIPKQ